MNKNQKRILLVFSLLCILGVTAILSWRYIPFNKILKISGTKEPAFVNVQQINTEAPHTLYYDFEVDPKSGNAGNFYKGIAHSGQYSTKTFGKNSFSFAVERKAADIGLDNLGAVSMSAWVYIFPGKNEPLGTFVFSASNDNINVAWKGITISGNDLPRGKWFKISGMFELTEVTFKPDYKLVFYFWNNSKTDILIDDFYIVFGGPKPRKGDSTLVDLTRGIPFTPKFNFPPYPFHLFQKENIGNDESPFLINHGKIKEGDLSPYDRIFTGHYLSGTRMPADLLVIDKAGVPALYSFCADDKIFRKITPMIPPEVKSWFKSAEIVSGCFLIGGASQVLLSGSKGLIMGEFEKIANPCSGKDLKVSFKTLLNIPGNPLFTSKGHLISADLDGNKINEILSVRENGSWNLYRFEQGSKHSLSEMASGESDPLKQWNGLKNNVRITPGRFLQKYYPDILLTVSGERSKKGYTWSLIRFDPASRSFIPCFGIEQNHFGKTIGPDTLKPSDEFITGIFRNDGKINVFRYNRDWRYDLKEIHFNDSTFQVIANMDFTGYEKDFNPKYYEILRIVPGMLLHRDLTSLLVIGKNCKSRDSTTNGCREFVNLQGLPAFLQVYSLGRAEK